MKKLILIFFVFLSVIVGAQINTYPVSAGQYAIYNEGSSDTITVDKKYASGGVIAYRNPIEVVDTIFKVPSTASLDTLSNFIRPVGKRAAIGLERGGEWDGTITVSDDSLLFYAYGSGAKPKIYGSEVITGWELHSGNIYKATVADEVKQLFLNDDRMQIARYPNEDYFTITTKTSNTVFESTDLDGGMNYAGATCFIKSNPWSMPAVLVASSSSQTITLESAPPYGVAENYGFWLVDKLEFLTQAGEWYYDSGADTLYFWTPNGDSPDNYIVRASTLSQNVNITGRSYVTIKDIELRHSGVDGIYVSSSSNIQIKNCIVDSPDRFGIYELSGSNILVDNNQIEGAGTAIRTMGQSNTITNNLIQNTGLIRNFNKSTVDQDGMGMFVRGNNHVIHYNRVINTGYIGIASNGLNISIKYNYINGACSVLDDGAGIYVSSGTTGSYPRNDFTIGTVIESNIIENVHGTMDGKPSASAYPHGNGIYLDWSPKGVTIKNNVVNFVSQGLYIQGGGQNVVEGNIFMDAMIGYRYNAGNEVNTYKENIIYQTSRLGRRLGTTSATAEPRLIYSNTGVYGLWAFEDNIYLARYYQTSQFRYTNSGGTAVNTSDFAVWQSETGDNNSTYITTSLGVGETEQLFYNDTKQSKTFNLGTKVYRDIFGNEITGKLTLEPFTSVILIGMDFSGIKPVPEFLDQSFHLVSPIYSKEWLGRLVAFRVDSINSFHFSIIQGNELNYFSIDSVTGDFFAQTDIQTSVDQSFVLQVEVSDKDFHDYADSVEVTFNISGTDLTPPEIVSFHIPEAVLGLTVPIIAFEATDDVLVSGYKLSESASRPHADDDGWASTAPEEFSFSQEGIHTLYAWVKDEAGNVSDSVSRTVTIVIPDLSPTFSEYLFEESDGQTVLDSKGSNDGTLVNEFLRVEGAAGNAIEFAGSGYINLGLCFGENVQDEITLSAWIKPDSAGNGWQGIITHGGPDTVSFSLLINANTKSVGFKTNGTTSSWLTVHVEKLWDGNWHHITAVYNGSEKVIYIDNVLMSSIPANGKIDSGFGTNLLIGAGGEESNPVHLFEGIIDEIRIYNYALTPSGVGELFHPVNKELKKIFTSEDITICEGEDYYGWTQTGVYERVLQRTGRLTSDADSIVTTNLTVNQAYNITEHVAISEGENFNGLTEEGAYHLNLVSSGGCDSIVTINLTVEKTFTQIIELEKGWNIFSAFLIPEDTRMETVTELLRLEGKLLIVKDEKENTYEEWVSQNRWINYIGSLQKTRGYYILVDSNSALEITGMEIEMPLDIPLNKGKNIISFPFDGSYDAMQIVQPLIDLGILEKVQDEKGNAIEYWNMFGWLNGIGDFKAGEGYLVQVSDDGIFTMNVLSEKSGQIFTVFAEPIWYKVVYDGNGFAHMNINLIGLNHINLQPGDEIAVFDQHICVGAVKLTEKHTGLNFVSIPVSSSKDSKNDGFREGNPIDLEFWKNQTNERRRLLPGLVEGEMIFKKYESVFVSLKDDSPIVEEFMVYPNPARSQVFIQFPYLTDKEIRIILTDITGKQILNKIVVSNPEIINIELMPAGVYFISTSEKNNYSTHKLIII